MTGWLAELAIALAGSAIGTAPASRLFWGETAWASAAAVLLFIGTGATTAGWAAAAAGVSLWAWIRCRKRYRQIADLPTAKLASAPQGYVEVSGTGAVHPDYPLASPLTGLPCLWYAYTVWQGEGGRSTVVDSGVSDRPFTVDDGSGRALVVPDGAQVVTRHARRWRTGDYTYHERVILHGDTVYVLGEHVDSLRGGNASERRRNAVLAEWKHDQDSLKARFDADRDGRIDAGEWETARLAAERQALRDGGAEDERFLRKPADGRPFLIANYSAQQLAGRFRRWSWLHLGIFLAALSMAGWR